MVSSIRFLANAPLIMFKGTHLLLLPFGVHTLLYVAERCFCYLKIIFTTARKRDREARPNKYVVFAIIVPFLLSSTYWALQLAELLVEIQVYFIEPARQFAPNFTHYITLFNAVILLNVSLLFSRIPQCLFTAIEFQYLVSDAVVVWRAWVLCKDEFGRLLLIPGFLFTMTTRKS